MRISDQPAAVPSSDSSSEDVGSSEKKRQDEASSFSRTLAKKRDLNRESPQAKTKNEENPGAVADRKEGQSRLDGPISSEGAVGASPVAVPPELQQLVREISLVANAAGNQQVHIELNSNVLKGLHINIERQNGVIKIQFVSASAEVGRLLSSNLSSLTQGLADRGLEVGDIRVNTTQKSASASQQKQGSTPDRRWLSGRQGQRG